MLYIRAPADPDRLQLTLLALLSYVSACVRCVCVCVCARARACITVGGRPGPPLCIPKSIIVSLLTVL